MESYKPSLNALTQNGRVAGHEPKDLRGMLRKGGLTLSREQQKFIEGINEIARVLDSKGLRRSSWMVIAGGGVFLYQLNHYGSSKPERIDRDPTDLDVVIDNALSKDLILDSIKDAFSHPATVNREPVMHYGHLLKGPTLSTNAANGLDVDIITELSQEYPKDHRFAPSAEYKYPLAETLLSQAKTYRHPLIDGEIKVAHPGFIAFYKLMLYRDSNGKQDTADIKRLKAIGALDKSEELDIVLATMCHGNERLVEAIRKAIDAI
jgi:hypothetical protein